MAAGGRAPGRACCTRSPAPVSDRRERRYDALLLDAFGTLITVDAPAERLAQARRRSGSTSRSRLDDAQRAFTAEVAYYAERCHLGRDRREPRCAARRVRGDRARGARHRPRAPPSGRAARPRDPLPRLRRHRARCCAARPAPASRSRSSPTPTTRCPRCCAQAGVESTPTRCSARRATGSSKPDPASSRRRSPTLGRARRNEPCTSGDTPAPTRSARAAVGIDVRIIDRDGAYASERTDTIASLTEILELIA